MDIARTLIRPEEALATQNHRANDPTTRERKACPNDRDRREHRRQGQWPPSLVPGGGMQMSENGTASRPSQEAQTDGESQDADPGASARQREPDDDRLASGQDPKASAWGTPEKHGSGPTQMPCRPGCDSNSTVCGFWPEAPPYGRPPQEQPQVALYPRPGAGASPWPSLRSGEPYGASMGHDSGFKLRRPFCGNKRKRECGKRIYPSLPGRNRKRNGAGMVAVTTPTPIPRNGRGHDVRGRGSSLLGGGCWDSVPNSTTTPRPGRSGEILRAPHPLSQQPTEPINRTVPIPPRSKE
jgi:hypothetical protein